MAPQSEEQVPYSKRPDTVGGSLPAFPASVAVGMDGGLFVSTEVSGAGGLTKRELFAAMAMQGMAASESEKDGMYRPEVAAVRAVKFADALLKELAK